MKFSLKLIVLLLLEAGYIYGAFWVGSHHQLPFFNHGAAVIVLYLPFIISLFAFQRLIKPRSKWSWGISFLASCLGLWVGMTCALNQFGS